VDTRIRHQVGLELSNIDVEGSIKTKRSSQGGDNLGNETVQVGVGGSFDIQTTSADVVHSFVIKHDSDVSVLEERVGRQDRVVWFDNSGGDLRGGVDGETELGFFTVVNRETFEEKRSETRSSSTTNSMEDKETLKTSAVICKLTDTVESEIDNFLSDGVVTTGIIVGSIFLARDQLFGVKQLTVGTSADLINDSGLKIEENTSGDVLASSSLTEKGVESIITTSDGLVRRHLTIRLNTMLEAVQFPAGVTDLNTSLTDVDGDNFTHFGLRVF
jgi:hypothetical protein